MIDLELKETYSSRTIHRRFSVFPLAKFWLQPCRRNVSDCSRFIDLIMPSLAQKEVRLQDGRKISSVNACEEITRLQYKIRGCSDKGIVGLARLNFANAAIERHRNTRGEETNTKKVPKRLIKTIINYFFLFFFFFACLLDKK